MNFSVPFKLKNKGCFGLVRCLFVSVGCEKTIWLKKKMVDREESKTLKVREDKREIERELEERKVRVWMEFVLSFYLWWWFMTKAKEERKDCSYEYFWTTNTSKQIWFFFMTALPFYFLGFFIYILNLGLVLFCSFYCLSSPILTVRVWCKIANHLLVKWHNIMKSFYVESIQGNYVLRPPFRWVDNGWVGTVWVLLWWWYANIINKSSNLSFNMDWGTGGWSIEDQNKKKI